MKNFNKKIYITILTIVTIVCVLFGIVLHVVVPMFTHKNAFTFWGNGNVISEEYTLPSEATEISDIAFDGAAISINIRTSSNVDGIVCTYEGYDELMPEMNYEDGELSFSQHPNGRNRTGNIESPVLTITVNPDCTLDSLSLNIDAGDVTIRDISINKITGDLDAGNIEVYNSTISSFNVDCDAGNVQLNGGSIDSLFVELDAGNFEVYDITFTSLNGSCDMGNIEIHDVDASAYSIDAEIDLGELTVDGSSCGSNYHSNVDSDCSIVASASMGQIYIGS